MNRIIQMMISIIFLKITKAEGDGTTWVSPYIIYETGKTYPRPLLVTEADGDVLAFSSPIDGGSDSTTLECQDIIKLENMLKLWI